jgi:threonine aldolase
MPRGTAVQQLIDLRSDTVTLPSPDMRRAMSEAELGDDYYRDDPTVRALEERAAELLGKEAAMLVLSGTMGNLVAILAQAARGDSVILETNCHIANNEASHLSTLGSVATVTVKGEDGFFTPEQLEGAIFPRSILHSPTRVVCIENTHNAAGGRCMSPAQIDALCATAVGHGLAVHVDGARIFNAAVALGVPISRLVEKVDSITFCLTKGLACPVGSIVCGSRDFIETTRHWRQTVGGGMRQAGVFAAAGLVALDSMIERLEEDHVNARRLATLMVEAGLPVNPNDVQTNMVFVELPEGRIDPTRFVAKLEAAGVRINPAKGRRVRFVTHYGITQEDVDQAGVRVGQVCASFA